jgi:hypothetical protein
MSGRRVCRSWVLRSWSRYVVSHRCTSMQHCTRFGQHRPPVALCATQMHASGCYVVCRHNGACSRRKPGPSVCESLCLGQYIEPQGCMGSVRTRPRRPSRVPQLSSLSCRESAWWHRESAGPHAAQRCLAAPPAGPASAPPTGHCFTGWPLDSVSLTASPRRLCGCGLYHPTGSGGDRPTFTKHCKPRNVPCETLAC